MKNTYKQPQPHKEPLPCRLRDSGVQNANTALERQTNADPLQDHSRMVPEGYGRLQKRRQSTPNGGLQKERERKLSCSVKSKCRERKVAQGLVSHQAIARQPLHCILFSTFGNRIIP